ERAKRFFEVGFGAFSGALRRLAGEEDVLSERRQNGSVDLFGFAVPIDAGAIEIVNAQVVGTLRDGFGFVEGNKRKPAACLSNDGELFAGLAEHAPGNVAGLGLVCSRGAGSYGDSRAGGSSKKSSPP